MPSLKINQLNKSYFGLSYNYHLGKWLCLHANVWEPLSSLSVGDKARHFYSLSCYGDIISLWVMCQVPNTVNKLLLLLSTIFRNSQWNLNEKCSCYCPKFQLAVLSTERGKNCKTKSQSYYLREQEDIARQKLAK